MEKRSVRNSSKSGRLSGNGSGGLLLGCVLVFIVAAVSSVQATTPNPSKGQAECPAHWTRFVRSSARHDGEPVVMCVREVTAASSLVPPIIADTHCRELFVESPYGDLSPHTVSVHSSAENEQLRVAFFDSPTGGATPALALGGTAGFGVLHWFDGSDEEGVVAQYENFAADAYWDVRSGCIAMQPSGTWTLVSCIETPLPFLCGFDTAAAAWSGSGSTEPPTSTQPPPPPPTTTQPPTTGEKPQTTHRPPVPHPAPPCLPKWLPLPGSVGVGVSDSVPGEDGDLCFRAFAPFHATTGRRGLPQATADSYCHALHPRASLASVMSASEEAWVRGAVLPSLNASAGRWHTTGLAYIGGKYLYGGEIGSWSADTYLFNSSDFAVSDPSSPTWPTSANGFYRHWGPHQPNPSFGCLTLSTRAADAGGWAGVNCQADLPFVCSYLNDGSTYPSTSEGPSHTPEPTSTPTPGKEEEPCLEGWTHFGTACYRLYEATEDGGSADGDRGSNDGYHRSASSLAPRRRVSPADVDDHCGRVLDGVAANQDDVVHSCAVRTVEESQLMGELVRGTGVVDLAIIGVSFMESGAAGFYLDASDTLPVHLAEMLWAPDEPRQTQGCVAVDALGRWFFWDCGMPADAYVCQYPAGALKSLEPPPTDSSTAPTLTPEPSATPEPSVPGRVCLHSLSNAVHLIVSAGTVGVYTLDVCPPPAGRGSEPATDIPINPALYVYMAPVSPYFEYGVGADGVVGLPSSQTEREALFGDLLFNTPVYAPCDGFKKQSRVFRGMEGRVVVRHGTERELGYVCISNDGVHYVPTNVTYEVMGVTLQGFAHVQPRRRGKAWLPPLFHSPSELSSLTAAGSAAAAEEGGAHLRQLFSLRRFSSGVLQLDVRGGDEDHSAIQSIRLASTIDCANSAFTLLPADVPVRSVGRAYVHGGDAVSPSSAPAAGGGEEEEPSGGYAYGMAYQLADTVPTNLSSLHRLSDLATKAEEPPEEFYVCVATQRTRSHPAVAEEGNSANATTPALMRGSRVYMSDVEAANAAHNNNSISSSSGLLPSRLARTRLSALRSLLLHRSGENDTVPLVYTAVPDLKVQVTVPLASLRGVWTIAPRPEERVRFVRVVEAATVSGRDRYLLCGAGRGGRCDNGSTTAVVVNQYSSPLILLDADGLTEGMTVLLSQDGSRCHREQASGAQPAEDGTLVPAYLDTMLPISLMDMEVADLTNGTGTARLRRRVAFIQLNANHTGMWGSTKEGAMLEQITWNLCLSYDTISPFIPLRPLKIHVRRQRIPAATAVSGVAAEDGASWANRSSASPNLIVNVGFAGLIKLWGVDLSMWSEATMQAAQVALVELPVTTSAKVGNGGDGNDDVAGRVCDSDAIANRAHAVLSLVPPPSLRARSGNHHQSIQPSSSWSMSASDDAEEEEEAGGRLRTYAALVIPRGYFQVESSRPLRLCLSVPQPFSTAAQNPFHATDVTIDVRAVELLFVGYYGTPTPSDEADAQPQSLSLDGGRRRSSVMATENVVTIAEEADNVVLPLIGYGLRPDMTIFFSRSPCYGQTAERDLQLVQRQSVLNLSMSAAYDIPNMYWDDQDDHASFAGAPWVAAGGGSKSVGPQTQSLFMTLTKAAVTTRAVAEELFRGAASSESRTPLHMCLYAPGTAREVFPTAFSLVVLPPHVTTLRNSAQDAPLIKAALTSLHNESSSDGDTSEAVVVYASYMDIIVEGFGLLEGKTEFMAAVDCANVSSFLWRVPAAVSAIPSSTDQGFSPVERYVNPQTSMSSWFITLSQAHSMRVGAADWPEAPKAGDVISRFVWCVRYDKDSSSNESASKDDLSGFVSTGIPYTLIIPSIDGFRVGDRLTRELQLPTQPSDLGEWQRILLAGPIVDLTFLFGNPLYMFLAEETLSCKTIKNYYISENLLAEKLVVAVSGLAVVLPRLMTEEGVFKLCASAVYPYPRSTELGTEAALQFIELGDLRFRLVTPTYAVTALNGTTTVTVEQGQEWTLPITGSYISNTSYIRFKRLGTGCAGPMRGGLPDIAVRHLFEGLELFGKGGHHEASATSNESSNSNDNDGSDDDAGVQQLFVVLNREFIRGLDAPISYQLCFKPTRAMPWQASETVTLKVIEHIRRPTHYNYFAEDGSDDITSVTPIPPTKVALPWLTDEQDRENIVGTVTKEVSLALWCRDARSGAGARAAAGVYANVHSDKDSDDSSNSDDDESDDNSSRSSSSSSGGGGGGGGVNVFHETPCGDHRRVTFVKPMDDDSDPCFFDAEAIQNRVVRGPYVIDYGVLTLPSNLHADVSSTYPSVRQPWILCVETGPEQWRQPRYPLFQLQLADPTPVGFRNTSDVFSNTSASFVWGPRGQSPLPEQLGGCGTIPDRMGAEGNTTLLLHAEDSSQVFYLNGYAIYRGLLVRFGAQCDSEVSPPPGAKDSSSSDDGVDDALDGAVMEVQQLTNPKLYRQPLLIEDDRGRFLVPRTHLTHEQADPTPMCLSTDGGLTYRRTPLSLAILPSLLIRDKPENALDLLQRVFARTVVVPINSTGDVDLSTLLSLPRPIGDEGTEWDSGLPVGTDVRIAETCEEEDQEVDSSAGASPLVVMVEQTSTLRLTVSHTSRATPRRLRICARPRRVVGEPVTSFTDTGLWYRVLNVSVTSVAVHQWNAATRRVLTDGDGIRGAVLRRGGEDVLLSVTLQSRSGDAAGVPGGGPVAEGEEEAADVCSPFMTPATCLVERFLRMLDSSAGALPFFSLARFRVGSSLGQCLRPTTSHDGSYLSSSASSASLAEQSDSGAADGVAVSVDAVKVVFGSTTLQVSDMYGTGLRVVAPLRHSNDHDRHSPRAPTSLCLSVDGGRHYMAVGIVYFAANWAPTLEVRVSDDGGSAPDGSAAAGSSSFSTMVRHYDYSSVSGEIRDTRYTALSAAEVDDNILSSAAAELLGTLTTDALWTGFIGTTGFTSGRVLYLTADPTHISGHTYALNFTLDYRRRAMPTGLTLSAVAWKLTCLGSGAIISALHFVRAGDTGTLIPAAASCISGLYEGTRLRVVGPLTSTTTPSSSSRTTMTAAEGEAEEVAALCEQATASAFAFDAFILRPGAWAQRRANATEATAVQMPPAMKYVAGGVYGLCYQQFIPVEEQKMTGRPAPSHMRPTPVRLWVSREVTVQRVGFQAGSTLVVFQGSRATLAVEGSAVALPRTPLLLAFAPVTPHNVVVVAGAENVTATLPLRHGCRDVPATRDPITGDSLMRLQSGGNDTLAAAAGEDRLLAAPWMDSSGGWLTISPAYTGACTTHTLLHVCYSVDFGMSFQAVSDLRLAIHSPTITGLHHVIRAEGSGGVLSQITGGLSSSSTPSPAVTSPSAMHVQRLVETSGQTVRVFAPTVEVRGRRVLSRAPSFYYPATSALVGNGIGVESGRSPRLDGPPTEPGSTSPSSITAGAVAVLRTSKQGSMCTGTVINASNTTSSDDSALAMPIFIMDLRTAAVWGSGLDGNSSNCYDNCTTTDARVNPVLSRGDWLNNTARLLEHYGADGVLSLRSVLQLASGGGKITSEEVAASLRGGESLLVCLSIDGERYFSANTPVYRGEAAVRVGTSAMAAASPAALLDVPSLPLFIRTDMAHNGSYAVRDLSMLTEVVVRPRATAGAVELLEETISTVARLQLALARALHIHDASVIVVQLQRTGDMPVPIIDVSGVVADPLQHQQWQQRRSSVMGGDSGGGGGAVDGSDSHSVASDLSDEVASSSLNGDDNSINTTTITHLPTYALSISIAADTHQYVNGTNSTAPTVVSAPALLIDVVELLLANSTRQAELLGALLPPTAGVAASDVRALTLNFTFSNGEDLHAAVRNHAELLPASEGAWRRRLLAIPYDAVSPTDVPSTKTDNSAWRVTWWTVLLMLVLPIALAVVSVRVYKKYLARREETDEGPVVEAAESGETTAATDRST